MTKGLLVSRKSKLKLRKRAVNYPTNSNRKKFKEYKNLYNKVIRLRKKLFFNDELIKCQGDLKASWNILREASCIKKSSKIVTEKLIINDEVVQGEDRLSQAFK